MSLNESQRRVLLGMLVGLIITGMAFGATVLVSLLSSHYLVGVSRWQIASMSAIAPTCTLLICIMRLAKHRFVTPQDLDGSGLTANTKTATLLQALLQNTLEQLAVALPVYAAWSAWSPEFLLNLATTASILFLVGRIYAFAVTTKVLLDERLVLPLPFIRLSY